MSLPDAAEHSQIIEKKQATIDQVNQD